MAEDLTHWMIEQMRTHGFWVRDFMPGGVRANEFAQENATIRELFGADCGMFLCKPPRGHAVRSLQCPKADGEYLEVWRVHPAHPEVAVHVTICEDQTTYLPIPFGERVLQHLAIGAKMSDAEYRKKMEEGLAKFEKNKEESALAKGHENVERMRWAFTEDAKNKVSETVLKNTGTDIPLPVPVAPPAVPSVDLDTRAPLSKSRPRKEKTAKEPHGHAK